MIVRNGLAIIITQNIKKKMRRPDDCPEWMRISNLPSHIAGPDEQSMWSAGEIEDLMELKASGMSFKAAAKRLNRTEHACESKYYHELEKKNRREINDKS